MNKIYKVKYNAQTGQYTVVSELAKSAVKTGKVLTALLAAAVVPTVLAAGPDGASNNRPSDLASRTSTAQIDSLLTEFRKDPMNLNRYHINSLDHTAYYKAIANNNRAGLVAAGVSESCLNLSSLHVCGYEDRVKMFQYTADYAIDATFFRDEELQKLRDQGTLDSNNIWHNGVGGELDLTPGGENNKAEYTLSGGNWDHLDLGGHPDSRYHSLKSSIEMGIADDGRGQNSGLYRDVYVDNAKLTVLSSATFLSRSTNHVGVITVTDGGVVDFQGEYTNIIDNQLGIRSDALYIGYNDSTAQKKYGDVTAKNLNIWYGNDHTRGPGLNGGGVRIFSDDDTRRSTLSVSKDLTVDVNPTDVIIGNNGVYLHHNATVTVGGKTDIRVNGVQASAIKLGNAETTFNGKGDIKLIGGSYRHWSGGYDNVYGVTNIGGQFLADSNVDISMYSEHNIAINALKDQAKDKRSVNDIAGNLNIIHGEARSYDRTTEWATKEVSGNGKGIFTNGGDVRVSGNYTGKLENSRNSVLTDIQDGHIFINGNMSLESIGSQGGASANWTSNNQGTGNNTLIRLNGNNANLQIANNTQLNIKSFNSVGIEVIKGQAVIGKATNPDSATFRLGTTATTHENAIVQFNLGNIESISNRATAVLLSPENGKSANYTQAAGTLVKTTGADSNGILVKQADNTNVNFDVTIHGKVEQTGVNAKDANGKDQYAAVNLSGTGELTASNTTEILNNEDQVAILKRDNGDITADVAAKVIGRVMLTGEGINSLTLSGNADSKLSNMKVIDGGQGGKASTLTLKSGGYLLNAYTDANKATQALPAGQTVSQLLNWDTINLDSTGTTTDNFVRLNLVGDTEAKDKVSIGANNWLTKRETQNVKLTTALLENNGTIDLRDNQFGANNGLTVTGNYVGGAGSRLLMSTNWNRAGMDENGGGSQSDLLHIQGKASGSTQVIPTTKDMTKADNRILGDVAIKPEDMTQVGDEVKTLQSQTSTEKVWLYTTNFAKRINTVVVVKVDGQDDGNSFTGTAAVDDGTEVQLANREAANGGREYYWTMYGTRQVTRTESETIPTDPQDPPPPPPPPTDDVPTVQPKVPVYVNTPSSNLELGYTGMSSLHERRGENQATAWDSCGCVQEQAEDQAWVRLFGKHLDKDGKYRFNQEQDIYGVQIGWDWDINYNREKGSRNHSGAYLSYARGLVDHFDRFRRENGELSADKYMGNTKTHGYSLGLTHTRYAKHGGYVDGVLQFSYLQNTHNPRNTTGGIKQNGYAAAASLEVGRPYAIGKQNRNEGGWIIEPQAQLTYQFLHLGRPKGENLNVTSADTHGLRGRLGFRLAHNSRRGHFTDSIYFSADILQDILGGGGTRIQGATATREYNEKFNRTWWQVGVGGQIPVSKHSYLYASAHYEHSFSGTKREGYRGSVGYRLTW